ncbi:tyrosine-type recombinase/integrase [Bdellovibrionota bacterium FG-2]
MKNYNSLPQYSESFFSEHLPIDRGLSPNTIKAYRDAMKLFLLHLVKNGRKDIMQITIDDLTADSILEFLKMIETDRKNSAVTRNQRLAALRVFSSYLATKDVLHLGKYQKILLIPRKREEHAMMTYLEVDEIKAIFSNIKQIKPTDRRDYVLLSLLYNTGARAQEICDLKVGSLRLASPPQVTIRGKGKKTRQVPLWKETTEMLIQYIEPTFRS